MVRKFAFIFDNFDQTTINKNIGLFAQFVSLQGVTVEIITNSTADNAELILPYKNMSLIRLKTKKTWEPLDDKAYYTYIKENINSYFALWLYRGRRYTADTVFQAYKKNITTVIKLDSDTKTSLLGSVLLRLPQPLLKRFYRHQMKLYSILQNNPFLPPIMGYLQYDLPLLLASYILYEDREEEKKLKKFFTRIMYYPNSFPAIQVSALEKKWKSKKKNLIISVGRIVPQKGYETGIRAFAILPNKLQRKWKYEIIGPVHDKEYFKSLQEVISVNKMQAYITLKEGIYGTDLYKKYAESKVLLMPYHKPANTNGFEGQPNVIVDGMYFKNVCVATDVGNVRNLITKLTGKLISVDSSTLFSSALEQILEDKSLEKMGNAARERIIKYFNFDMYAIKLFTTITTHDYQTYLSDQHHDYIVGETLRNPVYKYCDLLTSTLLPKFPYQKAKILDIGCREFYTYDYFREKYKLKITGIDIGEDAIRVGREKHVTSVDIHEMEKHFGRKTYDILFSFHVFEHMYDLEKALKNCYDVLKKDGYLFFAVPMPSEDTRRGHWAKIDSEKDMLNFCKKQGFKKIFSKVYDANMFRDESEMIALVQKI